MRPPGCRGGELIRASIGRRSLGIEALTVETQSNDRPVGNRFAWRRILRDHEARSSDLGHQRLGMQRHDGLPQRQRAHIGDGTLPFFDGLVRRRRFDLRDRDPFLVLFRKNRLSPFGCGSQVSKRDFGDSPEHRTCNRSPVVRNGGLVDDH
jgi:hypothetical protein